MSKIITNVKDSKYYVSVDKTIHAVPIRFEFVGKIRYDTFNAEIISYINNMVSKSLPTIVCSADTFPELVVAKEKYADKNQHFKNAICMDMITDGMRADAQRVGLNMYSFAEVEEAGRSNPIPYVFSNFTCFV